LREQEWLKQELEGFKWATSPPWQYLKDRHGDRVSKQEIISLGQVCSAELEIKLVREYKRRKQTMLKWFSNHWDSILPFLETRVEILKDRSELERYSDSRWPLN
jgi:hypothetical protein